MGAIPQVLPFLLGDWIAHSAAVGADAVVMERNMAWKPAVNYRLTAVVTPTPEPFTIDASGVALLAEAPADPAAAGTPMTVLVGGVPYTRVTGSPAQGSTTFRVKSQTVVYADLQPHTEYLPLLEFHPERAAMVGTCSYYRTGTVYTAEWFAGLLAHLTPLVGIADEAELPPATTDVGERGYPGDQAFLEDGSLYFSTGTEWLMTAGGAGTPRTRTPDITADAAVQEQGIVRTVDADARVAELFTRTAVVDADATVAAANERQVSVDADAAVLGSVLKTVDADAQPVLRSVPAITVDAAVQSTISKPLTADAAVLATVNKYLDASAYVDVGTVDAITSPADAATVAGTGGVDFAGTASTGEGSTAELWDADMSVGKIVTVGPGKTYASLQAAITGEVSAHADLTNTRGTLDIVLYAVDDTTAANVTGFTTDATHFVNIYCAPAARHAGVWDGDKYNLIPTTGVPLTIGQAWTRVGGLQVQIDQDANDIYGIHVTANNVRVSGCLVTSGRPARDHYGIVAFENTNITTAFYAWNNVIYGCGSIGLMANPNSSATSYIYNNTFYGNRNAIYSNRTAVFKNNLFAAQTTATFSDSGTSTGSDYNSTSSAAWGSTYSAGAHDQAVSRTFTFTNAAGKDFSLTTGDAGAYQLGVDLSADAALPFSDNAAGVARTGSWNIGAL